MKYFSTFSGIGGFERGIIQAYESFWDKTRGTQPQQERKHTRGVQLHTENNREQPICAGYSEIDKYATQIYEKHFPNHTAFGDITKINAKELPDFELLVGGFPCQTFSIAGKRGGFNDTRGTMFFEIARIAKEKQPRLLLLENVKGLLSHNAGATFYTIITALDELGYDTQWQVLNSKNHGVPQKRERVFIIGHLRGTPRPKVFPFGENDEISYKQSKPNKRRAQAEVSGTLKACGAVKADDTFIQQLNHPTHSNDRVYGTEGVSPTLNTMQGGRRQPFVVASRGRNPQNPSDRTVGAPTEQRLEPNTQGTSNTLTGVQKDNWLCDNTKIRRLTPLECEHLQGFPDHFTAEGTKGEISDTQRYKVLGNAITVNVVQAIMEKLISRHPA